MLFAIDYSSHAPPLSADGQPQKRCLRGRLKLPEQGPGPYPVVLIAHGYTSFMDWGFLPRLSDHLAQRGIASLRFNFSGSGIGTDLITMTEPERFNRNSYLHELDDLAQLRAKLDSGHWPTLDPERCSIFGHSRGGAMSLLHAAEKGGYRSVVTWAAMDRILQFSPERLQQWEDQGQLDVMHWTAGRRLPLDLSTLHAARGAGPRLDVLAACRRLQLPQLIVMGDADRSLEFAVAERLHQAGGKHSQLLRIPSGDHTFGTQHPCPGPLPPMLSTVLNATGNHFARHG